MSSISNIKLNKFEEVIDKCVGSGLILPACKDHARPVVLVVYFSVFLLLSTIYLVLNLIINK